MVEIEEEMVNLLLDAIDSGYLTENTIGQFTYRYMAALLSVTTQLEKGKNLYLKIKSYLEEINLSRMRKQQKIIVGFIANYSSTWIGDKLYQLLKQSEKFEPYVFLVANHHRAQDDNMRKEEYIDNLEYFQKRNLRIVKTLNLENGEEYTWKEIGVKPQICIWLTPWTDLFSEEYHLLNYPLDILHTYIPYGFMLAENEEGNFAYHQYNQLLHNFAWKIFEVSHFGLKMAEKYSFTGAANVCYTGYPKMDAFYQPESKSDIWDELVCKTGNSKAKKIIYAPHHSVYDEGTVMFSTFENNYEYILELAEKYQKETLWVFKPHPGLKQKAIYAGIFQNEEEWNTYIDRWSNLSNARVIESGSYCEIFLYSDAMILDSISFLAEYLYANKPALLLERKEQRFNDFGKILKKAYYTVDGKNRQGIEEFLLKIIIDANDEKREIREKIFAQNLDYVKVKRSKAAENIYNELLNLIT